MPAATVRLLRVRVGVIVDSFRCVAVARSPKWRDVSLTVDPADQLMREGFSWKLRVRIHRTWPGGSAWLVSSDLAALCRRRFAVPASVPAIGECSPHGRHVKTLIKHQNVLTFA